MAENKAENKERKRTANELRKMRDEIRVQLHLAGMDARAFWESVEPKLVDLEERLERGATATARYADIVLEEMAKALERMRDRFTRPEP